MKQALYIGVLLGTVMLAGCSAKEETNAQTKSDEAAKVLANEQTNEHRPVPTNAVVETKSPLPLTQEQKEAYHKQYEEMVNQANETKIGINLGVPSIEEFEPEDWAEPEEYEQRIQEHIDSFLASEREALGNLSSSKSEVVRGSNGEMKKTAYLYVSDKVFSVEVSGEFDTQFSGYRKGQVFSKVDQITSHIASSSSGEWKQTFSEAKLIDNGRTYSLLIEGVYTLNRIATKKAFTVEFSCDEFGMIH
ncbi:hypothetical protein ACQKL5_08680 [Peribacillus sp. NPDC097675]|uniref:hypothetical protein n=1 Tax=Peribacillus sp. NPDC097675 TaxID=3390618 RepID=UPI003CFE033D